MQYPRSPEEGVGSDGVIDSCELPDKALGSELRPPAGTLDHSIPAPEVSFDFQGNL